jgi:ADP-ribose pyrophosphatase YjhB (NUDIX family)
MIMKNTHPKFCYACGSPLAKKFIDGKMRLVCENCDTITYINPKPCVSAIILDHDKILLTRRKYEPFQDYWDIPGGFIEGEEHPEAGLHREILEELGLEIHIESLFGIFMDTYGEENGFPTLNMFYRCKHVCEPKFVDDDIVEYQWFSIHQLPDKIAFKCCKEALRQLMKSFGKN